MTANSPCPILHRHQVRVYWEDTDAGGVVFYANYLRFFERARTEWLRTMGFGQQQLKEREGLMFVVSRTAVDYLSPARLDDELDLTVSLKQRGRVSMVIAQQALRGTELLAQGEIRIACVHAGTLKPQPIPTAILDCIA